MGNVGFTCGLKNLNGSLSITEGVFTNISYAVAAPTGGNNSFACTIDGAAFVPTQKTAILTSGQIGITGTLPTATSQKSVILFLSSTVTPGTYAFDLIGSNGYTAQYQVGSAASANIHLPSTTVASKVTITSHNTATRRIIGTFYGTFSSLTTGASVVITAGSFDVVYQ